MRAGETRKNIDRFFSYFEAERRFLSELLTEWLPPPKVHQRYGYVLVTNMRLLQACTHLEALGRVASPDATSPRKRFAAVLLDWSGMREWGLVSLPEMWRAVQDPDCVVQPRLQRSLRKLGSHWRGALPAELVCRVSPEAVLSGEGQDGRELDASIDQTQDALRGAGVPGFSDFCGVLAQFTYAAILWRDYRCGLAHEARRLANGWDLADGQAPYYHPLSDPVVDRGRARFVPKSACLVIPDDFVLRALGKCIGRLRAHCEKESIDPYGRGRFG